MKLSDSVVNDDIYPKDPRPSTVETKSKVLTYPNDPRPSTVETKSKVLTYPRDPRPSTELTVLENPEEFAKIPATVDVRESVEIYPADPRPRTVEVRLRLDTYPEDPRPCIEDVRDSDDIYFEEPKPTIEDNTTSKLIPPEALITAVPLTIATFTFAPAIIFVIPEFVIVTSPTDAERLMPAPAVREVTELVIELVCRHNESTVAPPASAFARVISSISVNVGTDIYN